MSTRKINCQSRPSSSAIAGSSGSSQLKQRQVTQLNAQLEQLGRNLDTTRQLVNVTAVQAEDMRVLGSWHGALFMAASKVLSEECVNGGGGGGK